jgi:hypothetical protein
VVVARSAVGSPHPLTALFSLQRKLAVRGHVQHSTAAARAIDASPATDLRVDGSIVANIRSISSRPELIEGMCCFEVTVKLVTVNLIGNAGLKPPDKMTSNNVGSVARLE